MITQGKGQPLRVAKVENMKTKITRKQLRNPIGLSYSIHGVLKREGIDFPYYNSGTYGWNYDAIDLGVCDITVGYRYVGKCYDLAFNTLHGSTELTCEQILKLLAYGLDPIKYCAMVLNPCLNTFDEYRELASRLLQDECDALSPKYVRVEYRESGKSKGWITTSELYKDYGIKRGNWITLQSGKKKKANGKLIESITELTPLEVQDLRIQGYIKGI